MVIYILRFKAGGKYSLYKNLTYSTEYKNLSDMSVRGRSQSGITRLTDLEGQISHP